MNMTTGRPLHPRITTKADDSVVHPHLPKMNWNEDGAEIRNYPSLLP